MPTISFCKIAIPSLADKDYFAKESLTSLNFWCKRAVFATRPNSYAWECYILLPRELLSISRFKPFGGLLSDYFYIFIFFILHRFYAEELNEIVAQLDFNQYDYNYQINQINIQLIIDER